MGITQKVSNDITQTTQNVSNAVTNATENVSSSVQQSFEENTQLAGDILLDGVQTVSLFGNLARSAGVTEDEQESLQDERLRKYGDPSASVKTQREDDINPYDYPKALRKYL